MSSLEVSSNFTNADMDKVQSFPDADSSMCMR